MKKIILLLFILLVFFTGCPEKDQTDVTEDTTQDIASDQGGDTEAEEAKPVKEQSKPELQPYDMSSIVISSTPERTEAHSGYLNDPVTFEEYDISAYGQQTMVVGSREAVFYPNANVSDTASLNNLAEGGIIPLGTILPKGQTYTCSDGNYGGLYKYQDHFNYFYSTEWNGQQGLVYGADLVFGETDKNIVTANYYLSEGRFDVFQPYVGYTWLPSDVRRRLEEEKLAFQKVKPNEYWLSVENPDDMIALYKRDADDDQKPIFITTDLYAHGMHLFFDSFLQHIEEDFFIPRLGGLVDSYLAEIAEREATAGNLPEDHPYRETLVLARNYFLVADALLALTPVEETGEDEWGRPESQWVTPDADSILPEYPEKVQEEVRLILAADDQKLSPNFEYKEDYSQFKPRGHYTKNGVLETYFRTMMWFGRLHILMSTGKELPLYPDEETNIDTPENISIKMMPVAMLITDITAENEELYAQWQFLFDPITDLIGISDDLSFYEAIPFWEEQDINDFVDWNASINRRIETLNAGKDSLRPPVIAGNSVFTAPTDDGLKPPLGWRLFGQRFTYDSYIHHNLSPPRLFARDIVRGLDIMAVFGSRTADQLLADSDYPQMEGLETRVHELRDEFDTLSPGIWSETYYNRVLYLIKSQALFEPGSGFYFTESPAWGLKAMLSSHGTWAALRHDTILYVKQSYAERAGGGDYEPTYRTLPVPQPTHYIEPNVMFFEGALAAMGSLKNIMIEYDMQDGTYGEMVDDWISLLGKSYDIVKKEYDDEAVSSDNVRWIRTIPQAMVFLVLDPSMTGYGQYAEDSDQFKGAIVADVFTNSEMGVALEVAIGIPYRIYVPLNDGQGGKRIAVGYTFSYYEFLQSQNDRLNNEQWREWVYGKPHDYLDERQPFWSQGLILDPR